MVRARAPRPVGLVLVLLLASPLLARAQDDAPKPAPTKTAAPAKGAKAEAADGAVGRQSLVTLIKSANPMVWPLALCSVVTLSFALERLIALRRNRVIPRDFVERFLDRLSGGKLDRDRATELCKSNDSAAARVFGVIVSYWGQPAAVIRQAVAHDAAAEVLDLRRNVRVLNATATLAPLLGLLGTVIGMIEAFDALGGPVAGGLTKSERLAHGISLALMATAAGLLIAIVSIAVYYFLLNRIDVLVRDLDDQARKVIDLVASDPMATHRPAVDRRSSAPGDHFRGESRTLGRSEPL